MADLRQEESLSYREKKKLILIEKGLLAGIIALLAAALAFASTVVSDRFKTVWSTEFEKLFDDRLKAYSELLQRADEAVSSLAEEILVPRDPNDPLAFDTASPAIRVARAKWCEVYPNDCSGSSGGDIGGVMGNLIALERLDEVRSRHRILIPNDLNVRVNELIQAIAKATNTHLLAVERFKPETPIEERLHSFDGDVSVREAWIKVLETHRQLTDQLRKTLGLDLTPTKPFVGPY